MRHGKLSEDQRQALRSRILGNGGITNPEWRDAVFLVSRNQIRVQIDFDATKEYAENITSSSSTLVPRILTKNSAKRIKTSKFSSALDIKENALSGILPLSIGMKVTLTVNICTNDGLADGAEGIVRQIVFDEGSVDQTNS